MTVQPDQLGPPGDDGAQRPSCSCEHELADTVDVALEELLFLGEQDHLGETEERQRSERRTWLQQVAAVIKQASRSPRLRLAASVTAVLVGVDLLAPEATAEVCSTMLLAFATRYVQGVRHRRRLAVAG